jgi:glucose-6-phosphate isomerase
MPPHINPPSVLLDPARGHLRGAKVTTSQRVIRDLPGLFEDEAARRALPQDTIAYRVEAHMDVPQGREGGLFFGTSYVMPGRVGDEYFMTKGHFHEKRDTGEYYWGIQGRGLLILMDEQRVCWAEEVFPGSLHYIPGKVAHRLANTGDEVLAVGACWLSESGHDYAAIEKEGFSARAKCVNGKPALVPAKTP